MASFKERDATRKRIRSSILRIIKKTPHTQQNMPWSEISEGMTSEMAELLCADLNVASGISMLLVRFCVTAFCVTRFSPMPDTAQMKKWELCNKYGGDTIAAWLATDPVVKGVKFSGKCVQCLKRGRSPR